MVDPDPVAGEDGVAAGADRRGLRVVVLEPVRREVGANWWLTFSAATEVTHGACENGLSDISAFVRPLFPAAKKTFTPRSATALVATLTGARGSNCWNELPQELLITVTPHSSGWSSRWSYAVTTAVVNSTSPIE